MVNRLVDGRLAQVIKKMETAKTEEERRSLESQAEKLMAFLHRDPELSPLPDLMDKPRPVMDRPAYRPVPIISHDPAEPEPPPTNERDDREFELTRAALVPRVVYDDAWGRRWQTEQRWQKYHQTRARRGLREWAAHNPAIAKLVEGRRTCFDRAY